MGGMKELGEALWVYSSRDCVGETAEVEGRGSVEGVGLARDWGGVCRAKGAGLATMHWLWKEEAKLFPVGRSEELSTEEVMTSAVPALEVVEEEGEGDAWLLLVLALL